MPITLNNYEKPIQLYQQPLASVFNHIKEEENMKFNESVPQQATENSLVDNHDSSLQQEKPDKKSNKFTCSKIYRTSKLMLGILAPIAVITNNGFQVWQNVNNNGNINYPTDPLDRVEIVQLDSKKTE